MQTNHFNKTKTCNLHLILSIALLEAKLVKHLNPNPQLTPFFFWNLCSTHLIPRKNKLHFKKSTETWEKYIAGQ